MWTLPYSLSPLSHSKIGVHFLLMWVYITLLATTALALFQLAKDWREYKTKNRRITILSLIVVAGIAAALGTYFSDRAAERQHSEEQARIVKLQSAVDAQAATLETIVLQLQARVEQSTPSGPPVVSLSWEPSAPGKTIGEVAVGYCIYRSWHPHDVYKMRLNAAPVTTTSYTDRTVQPGNIYYYVVAAINALGQLSAPSNERVEHVPVYDGHIPAPSRYAPAASTSSLTQSSLTQLSSAGTAMPTCPLFR